jgi:hypothetical protein
MAVKLLKTSQLKEMTYGSFHRNGVSVDVSAFLRSDSGRRMLDSISPEGNRRDNSKATTTPKGGKTRG